MGEPQTLHRAGQWYLVVRHGERVVRRGPHVALGETDSGELSFETSCAQAVLDVDEEGGLVVRAVDGHGIEPPGGARRDCERLVRERGAEIRLAHNVLLVDTEFVEAGDGGDEPATHSGPASPPVEPPTRTRRILGSPVSALIGFAAGIGLALIYRPLSDEGDLPMQQDVPPGHVLAAEGETRSQAMPTRITSTLAERAMPDTPPHPESAPAAVNVAPSERADGAPSSSPHTQRDEPAVSARDDEPARAIAARPDAERVTAAPAPPPAPSPANAPVATATPVAPVTQTVNADKAVAVSTTKATAPSTRDASASRQADATRRQVDAARRRTLSAADQALLEGRLTTPRDTSAYTLYSRALALDPASAEARRGLQAVREQLINRALAQLAGGTLDEARSSLQAAADAGADPTLVGNLRNEIDQRQQLVNARGG